MTSRPFHLFSVVSCSLWKLHLFFFLMNVETFHFIISEAIVALQVLCTVLYVQALNRPSMINWTKYISTINSSENATYGRIYAAII